MPSGERINSSPETNITGEVADQTPRSTYEARGEKANQSVINETEPAPEAEAEKLKISDLSLEDLLTLDVNKYSEQELLEAKARLEEERKALLALEEKAKAQATASQPEISEPEASQPEAIQPATAANPETSTPALIPEPELKDTSGIDIVVADTPDAELEVEEELVNSAAGTVPIIPPIDAERTERMEAISPEEARATFEKAKKKSRVREFFNKTATKVVAGVMAFIIVTGGAFHVANLVKANQDQAQQPGIEQVVDKGDEADEEDDIFDHVSDKKSDQTKETDQDQKADQAESQEAEKNVRDGYDKKGMYSSTNKSGAYDFASASEVSEVCHGDKTEMVKYTAGNQIESLADYVAHLPEDLQPEGFKGLSILDTEHKLESLSDAEYQSVLDQFNKAMDKSKAEAITLSGDYHNAYMYKDANALALHDNIQLVEWHWGYQIRILWR